jgi:hypothetical protein
MIANNAKAFVSTFAVFPTAQSQVKNYKRANKPLHLDTHLYRQSTTEKEGRRHNRRLAKKRVQCLNEALSIVSSSVLADSLVLRNPLLRQAPNRKTNTTNIK